MYTYVLVLLVSVLASVWASSGDRKWLLNMMLGMPEDDRPVPPTYDPTWTPAEEKHSFSDSSRWPPEEAFDRRNIGDLYSIRGLNSDFRSDPNVEKKWSKHANFHFSGFICCNQPPTPHPKTIKRLKRPNGSQESLRSILLKGIAKSLARDRLRQTLELAAHEGDDGSPIDGLGDINYLDVDPRFQPLLKDMNDDGYLDPENQLFPTISRRGGVSVPPLVRSKRGLPPYDEDVLSPGRFGRKRSWDRPQHELPQTPVILVFQTAWDVKPVDTDVNSERPRRRNNKFKNVFRSVGSGR